MPDLEGPDSYLVEAYALEETWAVNPSNLKAVKHVKTAR